ncbi:CD209 antigen-like protein C [Hippocampus comes]|uniref:CD209 antigen-like protein C n=1 Tax=Hippocampus comes TaxID=109280 RepID=A0A3Q2Z1G5_HIPCM|nr:PREDICTED: CD209 antigen-like protein C [Hippocampus comes]
MTDLDSNRGFDTLLSQNEDDVEPARKKRQQASRVILYKAAIANLAILAAILLIVDILLLNQNIMRHDTHRYVDDAELIEIELIKLQESYKSAVRNMSEANKRLDGETRRQTESNWEFEHHKRRTKDYEVQLDKIMKDVTYLKSYLPVIANGCSYCPIGWILMNSACYYFALSRTDRQKSWQNARDFCQMYGGDLIAIDSIEEEIATINYLRGHADLSVNSYNFWIGLYFHNEELWRWTDGRDLVEGYWADGESSDDVHQDCAALYSTENVFSAWISIGCINSGKWICEKSPRNPQ